MQHVTCEMQFMIKIDFKSKSLTLPSIYQKRAISDFCLMVRRQQLMVPRRTTYHRHHRQIRRNPYQDGSVGEPDQTLKKSKEANRKESFQDKGVIANCYKKTSRLFEQKVH